jgi:hypothetical protein
VLQLQASFVGDYLEGGREEKVSRLIDKCRVGTPLYERATTATHAHSQECKTVYYKQQGDML